MIELNELDIIAKKIRSIAHPMRIKIIHLLKENGEMNVTQIHRSLEIEQAVASHHLNILKSNCILESRREGKNTFYTLRSAAIIEFIDFVNQCGK